MEDFVEDLKAEEEDEVANQSSVIPMEYSDTIRGSALMRSVHVVRPLSIMLKISLS